MFEKFKEKTITEKLTRILGIPAVIITIAVGIKSLIISNEEKPTNNIQNSGNNSTIVTGNGNTFNNNTYNTIDSKDDQKKVTTKSGNNDYNTIKQPKINTINDGKTIIAILPFENITNDKEYEWLSKGIPESLLVNLSTSDKFTVIEGTLRDKVLDEINFQQGKYVDIKSAVRIGKMLGSREIIIGSFQIIDKKIKITSRIVDVENSKIIQSSIVEYEDSITDIFKMQKNYSNYFINKIDY